MLLLQAKDSVCNFYVSKFNFNNYAQVKATKNYNKSGREKKAIFCLKN